MRRIFQTLWTVLMNVWVISLSILELLFSAVVCPPALAVLVLVMRWPLDKAMQLLIYTYARVWLWILAPFSPLRRININKGTFGRPVVVVVNHYSFIDTYYFASLRFFMGTICVRAWPFKMLWYAPFMRMAGYINTESWPWSKVLDRSRDLLSRRRRVLMFPEGHRCREGLIGRFGSGAFKIATETGAPVVPVCIKGTREVLPAGRMYLRPARVTVQALEPVDPADFPGETGHLDMRKHVRKIMAETLEAMDY